MTTTVVTPTDRLSRAQQFLEEAIASGNEAAVKKGHAAVDRAKAVPGSSWVLGRPGSEHVDVLRGRGRHALNQTA